MCADGTAYGRSRGGFGFGWDERAALLNSIADARRERFAESRALWGGLVTVPSSTLGSTRAAAVDQACDGGGRSWYLVLSYCGPPAAAGFASGDSSGFAVRP